MLLLTKKIHQKFDCLLKLSDLQPIGCGRCPLPGEPGCVRHSDRHRLYPMPDATLWPVQCQSGWYPVSSW